ncbi:MULTISPECIES: hypothetical protein [Mycobacterium avium complex (MAC)]|uniref:Uncharacterized protein n=1 Tax=Mycobacterium intracellulare subsp. chimaera TaxID=222805 RepID=A0ABT7P7M2_MYCIT|nr:MULTISPECIES: hypothetical protein [Mycobacterium avium complex (MAC)]AOS94897.1 hypothetical protein AN480_27900 [Mycobacterium intracellulare subsp. chimaera]MDM3929248.1 hypothetical protein [Mycobacterium intracellulare subsp. chimaera]
MAVDDLDDELCRDPFEEGCQESLEGSEGWAGCCGNCADRMERLHNESDWGDDCIASEDGRRCLTCH